MTQRLERLIGENVSVHSSEPCYWWEGQWHDGAEFLRLAEACEKTLAEAGFTEGQRLVAMMKNCPMIPALSLAVWRLGGSFCPLNVASGMTALLGTLDLIEPFGVVASDAVKAEVGQVLQDRGIPNYQIGRASCRERV